MTVSTTRLRAPPRQKNLAKTHIAVWGLLAIFLCLPACAAFTVTVREPLTGERTKNYSIAVIELALRKTKPTYGDYELAYTGAFNTQRLVAAARENLYTNLVVPVSYDSSIALNSLTFINIPYYWGATSYRICFTHTDILDKLKKVTTIEQLKQYSIVQGTGWSDVKVLRANGFNVIEAANPDALFKIIAAHRADLYCLGINDFKRDYELHKDMLGLAINETFALVYPQPKFFYLNVKNTLAKQRIEDGLKIAYQDGSLKQLFLEFYSENIQFADIPHRKIFRLHNPLLESLSDEHNKYPTLPFERPAK